MKKLRKSKINQRIIQSLKRIGLVCGVLFLIVSFGKIQGTNSFFMDTDTINGNSVTSGWWVPPAVEVTSPDSGDKWQVGSQHNITWTADSSDPSATASMDIDIDYKCGAGSYSSIATGEANDGTYGWTIPPTISNDCYVRVTTTDSHGLSNFAESDQFEISWMVVMNEFLPNPTGANNASKPNGEWVELYNNGLVAIDVNGWYLYDSDNAYELQISTSNSDNDNDTGDSGETIVPAHGWLVVYRDNDADFSLNNSGGDTVKLYDGAIGSGANLLDSFAYSSTTEGKTYARIPDGTGSWVDPVPTPGGKNTKSNDLDDFQKYYEEFCFDKKDRPTCDKAFMESLDLLKKDTVPVVEAPITDPVPVIEDPVTPAPTDETPADPAPKTEEPVVTITVPPVDPEVAPEIEPETGAEVVSDISEKPAIVEEKSAAEEKSVVEENPADVSAKKEEEKPEEKLDKSDGKEGDQKEEIRKDDEKKKDESGKPDDDHGDDKESDSSANPTD